MPRSMYTKELERKFVRDVSRTDRRKLHVISGTRNRWLLVSSGKKRAFKAFADKPEAVIFAIAKMSLGIGQVIVHHKTGKVERRITFE